MRLRILAVAVMAVCVAVSCKTSSVKGYWTHHTPDITDIRAAEDEFADFAELAIAAPAQDAQREIDRLFDQLLKDEVAYYVYTGWVVTAFYSSMSPCRSCPLFVYSMERIFKDGIVDGYDAELYSRFMTACKTNRVGDKLVLPPLLDRDGNSATVPLGQKTLFLVVDLHCPSCLTALDKYLGLYEDIRHIALCSGYGRIPEIEGWTFYRAIETDSVYDTQAAPFYFIANSEDIIETTYTHAL